HAKQRRAVRLHGVRARGGALPWCHGQREGGRCEPLERRRWHPRKRPQPELDHGVRRRADGEWLDRGVDGEGDVDRRTRLRHRERRDHAGLTGQPFDRGEGHHGERRDRDRLPPDDHGKVWPATHERNDRQRGTAVGIVDGEWVDKATKSRLTKRGAGSGERYPPAIGRNRSLLPAPAVIQPYLQNRGTSAEPSV